MSILFQLLIGKEIARRGGVKDSSEQLKIGVLSAVVAPPMVGLVLAKVATDRSTSSRPNKPVDVKPAETGKRGAASG